MTAHIRQHALPASSAGWCPSLPCPHASATRQGLFVGTTGLAAFLSVRVAQEGRNTVLAVRDVFPAAWAGMAASTPLLADAEAVAAAAAGARPGASGVPVLPAWVASYQREALQLVQQSLPAVASWAEAQLYGFVEKQNLTAALG